MDKLIPYQVKNTEQLIKIIKTHGRGLDGSLMGLGKTYCAIVCCIISNLIPLIVGQKIVMANWLKILKELKCNYFGITSYELLRNMKYFDNENKIKACEFINYVDGEYIIDESKLPNNVIIIYDEVHKCKNIKTINGQILHGFSKSNLKILMLSGTVAEQPVYFILVGLVLRLYKNYEDGYAWIVKKSKLTNVNNYMLAFHNIIYPNYASKMDENIMKEMYPKCYIEAKCFDMKEQNEINLKYEELRQKLIEAKQNNIHSPLALYSEAFQYIEFLKVNEVVDEARKEIIRGNSVVIFVNYTKTLMEFSTILNTKCLIYGEINEKEKNENIKNFNDDIERIIICNIKCGSNSISLHDLNGVYPRVSYIMPTWSVTDLIQSLGRIYRANVKTITRQYIVFSNCINEIKIQEKLKDKINNIGLISNGNNKNESLFKIDNLIVKNEDIKTEFGNKQKITKNDKLKIKKEIHDKKIKEKNNQEQKELLYKTYNYNEIMKIMTSYDIRKKKILLMNESEEKQNLLQEINELIDEADVLLAKSFDNFNYI